MKKALQQSLFKKIKKNSPFYKKGVLFFSAVLLLPLVLYALFLLGFRGRIYPNITVANFDISGYAFGESVAALDVLQRDFLSNEGLTIQIEEEVFSQASSGAYPRFTFSQFQTSFDPRQTASKAYSLGRQGSLSDRFKSQFFLRGGTNLSHIYEIDESAFDMWLDSVAEVFDQPGVKPRVWINPTNEEIEVTSGENGYILNKEMLKKQITAALADLDTSTIAAEFSTQTYEISSDQTEQTKQRAMLLLDQELSIEYSLDGRTQNTWLLKGNDLISFLAFNGGYDSDQIATYLENLAGSVERDPQNALFNFENGRVTEFAPSQDGVALDIDLSATNIIQGLESLEQDQSADAVVLAVRTTPPHTITSEVNDLGIRELLGRGESTYRGSIPGRVFNVAHTAQKLHGILIPPGEEFSFNQTVGEISARTGYKSAYIISGGRTILGDGGGVCQDSTTLFRAVMDAGLPITERKSHSYRVGYYEQNTQPGYDATVYSPSVDFKFTNDTQDHILIQAHADSQNLSLVIELYGTNDGREATITNYQQWDAVPAPPPLYQDDPTLGPGVVKQIDWAAPGLKVKYDYIVTKDGQTHFEKTFYSNYRPWQAVYLRGV